MMYMASAPQAWHLEIRIARKILDYAMTLASVATSQCSFVQMDLRIVRQTIVFMRAERCALQIAKALALGKM